MHSTNVFNKVLVVSVVFVLVKKYIHEKHPH